MDISDAIFVLRVVAGMIAVDGTPVAPVINIHGNTSGNIINFGKAAIQGEWIYYGNDGLFKVRVDDTEKTKLSEDNANNINVVGDWIYYSASTGVNYMVGIYKIRTDGTEKTKLDEFGTMAMPLLNVIGDWIYYVGSTEEGHALCKIRTDGTGKTAIIHGDGEKWGVPFSNNIIGDWIYYNAFDGMNDTLLRIRTDGTERTVIKYEEDFAFVRYIVVGDWLYYSGYNSEIRKINTDGSQIIKVNDDNSDNINVVGDWIYYTNESDGGKIYRIHIDGSQRTKLNDDNSDHINIVGDWIYYNVIDDGMYKMRTDGTGRELV